MSEFLRLWHELRLDKTQPQGIVCRRLHVQSQCKVLAGVEQPQGIPCLVAEFDSSVKVQRRSLPRSKGFIATVQSLTNNLDAPAGRRLVVALKDPHAEDLFAVLCADVTQALGRAGSQEECVRAGIRRLEQWQRFLQKHSGAGLTEEEQRGLIGELVFLRDVVLARLDAASALGSWQGPRGSNQDFEFAGGSVEVKTTLASAHQLIRISNVRQLDDTGLGSLHLYVLPLDAHREVGFSLPELVSEVHQIVRSDPIAAVKLEELLADVGYMESQADRYSRERYTLRTHSFYRIRDGFPRILESDLLQGVGDVKYSIATSACAAYRVDEELAIATMGLDGRSL